MPALMSDQVVATIALLLGAVFAWASVAKILRFAEWKRILSAYGLPPSVHGVTSWGVPLVEALVVTLIVMGETRAGAALALMLLSGFSLALVRARSLQGERLPCGCFGRTKERDYRLLLARNAFLALLPATLLLGGRDVAPLSGARAPTGDDLVPTLLALAGILLALWTAREVSGAFRKGRS
jgi:hypothetical protein